MPRTMSSSMLAAIQASSLTCAIFVDLHFRNEVVYVWSGIGTIVSGGNTYQGVATFGAISTIEDTGTVEAKGITLTLSGVNSQALTDALHNLQLGAPCIVRLGLFGLTGSPPTLTLIADPIVAWSGRMDQPTFDVGSETATISINCENRLLDMNVAVDRRYTLEDSAIDNPGDLGLMFVNSIQEMTLYWGRTPYSGTNI